MTRGGQCLLERGGLVLVAVSGQCRRPELVLTPPSTLSLSLSLSAGPGIMSTICRYRGAARTLDTGTRCPELMRTSPDIGHWSALVTPSAMDSHSVMKSKICLLQIIERVR